MDVECDIVTFPARDRHPKIASEDLDGHRCLLLADSHERL
jgi:hypothetical protein